MPITLSLISDFSQFGFNILTGEACNYGLRILCDVTEDGKKIFCRTLGLPQNCELQETYNPNTLTNDKPPVGSIFFPRDLFGTMAVIALYSVPGVKVVFQMKHSFTAIKEEDINEGSEDFREHWKKIYDMCINYDYDGLKEYLIFDEKIREAATCRVYRGIQPAHTVRDGACISAMTGRSM